MHDTMQAVTLLIFIVLCLAGSIIAIMHETNQRDVDNDA